MGMGFTSKTKENNTNNSSESWGMGFLFIFFPEEEDNNNSNKILNKKPNNFSFSSSSSSFKSINTILKRSNSAQLLSKAQSTISICVLLIFITLLLFTLSTFEPTSPHHFISRKQLSSSYSNPNEKPSKLIFPHALQGMGSLYRRGTRAMNDLIIGHVVESVTVNELRAFLRLIHRSSVASKSDILLIFPLKSSPFDNAIAEESSSFLKLIHGYGNERHIHTSTTFDPTQFVISGKKENSSGEPIWGRKIRSGDDENGLNGTESTRSTRLSYGSVVSFDVDELDPENSLSGFLGNVHMNLRRWACYPMLLGRIRRNYRHIMLVDVKEYLVLGDSLSQLKNRSPETVMLPTIGHNKKKNSEKKLVDSGIVLGGARGVRRLGNAMVTEIARVAIQHKKKNSVAEPGLFNQLVGNEFMLKNVNLINSGESIHELSSLTGLNSNSNSKLGFNLLSIVSKYPIVRRGNSNLEINYVFKKYLCSSPLDSIAYSDC